MPAPKEPRKGKPWHHAKQSRHERGYDSRWVKLRKLIIARDKGLCQPCLRKGRPTPYRDVHHVIAKADGGTDDPENLVCICGPCHDEETLTQRGSKRQTIGDDGWPVE